MKTKSTELTGMALDWAVAKCEGVRLWTDSSNDLVISHGHLLHYQKDWVKYNPSTDWSQGGAILEREWVNLDNGSNHHPHLWCATKYDSNGEPVNAYGQTMLEAGLRCYVAAKLGDEITVPVQLMSGAAVSLQS